MLNEQDYKEINECYMKLAKNDVRKDNTYKLIILNNLFYQIFGDSSNIFKPKNAQQSIPTC